MTRLEQRLILAIVVVLVGGGVAYVAMGGLSDRSPPPIGAGSDGRRPGSTDATPPRPLDGAQAGAGMSATDDPTVLRAGRGGIPNGLREPTGEDLSDPKVVRELLRSQLADANPRWDYVAKLLAVYREPLEADVKAVLLASLEHGNAAGALQAFRELHDGSVVADLLRLLDRPGDDPHDRANALLALSTIPGADAAEVVTGIEGRLTGDLAHDRAFLQAIARVGGLEATRALLDAVAKSSAPLEIGADVFRELDFRKDPSAADHLASVLRTTTLSEAALSVAVELAGRTGATRALVESLLALDVDATPEPVRKRVVASLAATGDDAAIDHLLAVAAKGADYASVAAKSIGDVHSASPAMRAKLLEVAKATPDENVRLQTVRALGELRASPAVPFLTESLASQSAPLQTESVIALGRIGKDSEPATDALTKLYDGAGEALRQHIAITLGRIATERAKALLEQFLVAEKSDRVKTTLRGALRSLGR